jgi:hypothetical protein
MLTSRYVCIVAVRLTPTDAKLVEGIDQAEFQGFTFVDASTFA